MVKITSSDNQEFTISKEIAYQSVLIKNMLEDAGEADDQPIPLPDVSGVILQKGASSTQFRASSFSVRYKPFRPPYPVIEYATMHKDDPPAPPEDEANPKPSEDIDDRDKEFITVDQGTLFEIILAANYLGMKNLLDLGCKTVGNMIKGKTIQEIRKMFNIVNEDAAVDAPATWTTSAGTVQKDVSENFEDC
ncbi:hypothetical protein HDU83_001998 [Entophlyctis luteolus]|nr:hypothetical protein HDU83_001998 [Entophlyctis luteolus]